MAAEYWEFMVWLGAIWAVGGFVAFILWWLFLGGDSEDD